MDPLSISASIAGLLVLTGSVVKYLSTVEEAPEAREKLLLEVSSASGLLYSLKDICEQAELSSGCLTSLRSLCASQGPFEQFRKALELLVEKLAPKKGLGKAKRALTWMFNQSEVEALMNVVERQKTYFLLALQGNHLKLSQELARSVADVDSKVERIENGIRDIRFEQNRQGSRHSQMHEMEVLTWLSPTTFAGRQKDLLRQAQPGTGKWIFTNDAFKRWVASPMPSETLWLAGIPGSGKTTLASIVIGQLERDHARPPKVGVVYVFCDYKDPTQTSEYLKRTILRMLLQQLDGLPEEIEQLYQEHSKKATSPSSVEIDEALLATGRRFSRLFFVIDALDELSETDQSLQTLLKLSKDLHSNVRSLFTSRWTAGLKDEIQKGPHIEVFAHDEDICAYVAHEIESRSRLQLFVRKEPDFRDQIIDTVIGSCKGMFLVARLHMDSLSTKPHLRAAKLALKQLPSTIDGVYEDALGRIRRQADEDVALAWRVLSWTVCAVKRLSSDQLQHALAVDDDYEKDYSDHLDADALIDVDLILAVCAGLVVLDFQDSKVRLVHYTAQEFFKRHEQELLPHANRDIAHACIKYLSFRETTRVISLFGEYVQMAKTFPLLEYAASNWGTHFQKYQNRATIEDSKISDVVESFLSDSARVSAAAHHTFNLPLLVLMKDFIEMFPNNVSGLHLAAHFGLIEMIGRLLAVYDHEIRDSRGRTPLHWASEEGLPLAVELLLQNGGEVDAQDNNGFAAIHLASRHNHLEVLKVLLEHGCGANKRCKEDTPSPLMEALDWGSSESAIFLLNHDVNTNIWNNLNSNHLQVAIERELEDVVELLLQKGKENNIIDKIDLCEALHFATVMGNRKILLYLLKAGAQPNTWNWTEATALHEATTYKKGCKGVISLLLEFGADPNARDSAGMTPLHQAVKNGNMPATSILIDITDCDLVDDHENTVLHAAVSKANEKSTWVVQRLLEMQDIDIDAVNFVGQSALCLATEGGFPNLRQVLLDAGADPTLEDPFFSGSEPSSPSPPESDAEQGSNRGSNDEEM